MSMYLYFWGTKNQDRMLFWGIHIWYNFMNHKHISFKTSSIQNFARNSFKNSLYCYFQKLALLEGTPSYDVWKKNTDPMYLKIQMFHVLNPYQVTHHKAKPHIKEMGPYVFRWVQFSVVGTNVKIPNFYRSKIV